MTFQVENMTCAHCKMTIERMLGSIGAKEVLVNLEDQTVKVDDTVTAQQVIDILAKAGYDAKEL